MNATLLAANGVRRLDVTTDEWGDVDIPVTPQRTICLGRNAEEWAHEGPYVAFWALGPDADHEHEFHKVFGDKTRDERLVAAVFDGAAVEPQLPTKVINLDGVSVIWIDLGEHLLGHTVILPERCVPHG